MRPEKNAQLLRLAVALYLHSRYFCEKLMKKYLEEKAAPVSSSCPA